MTAIKLLVISYLVVILSAASAQTKTEVPVPYPRQPCYSVYPAGKAALMDFLTKNLKTPEYHMRGATILATCIVNKRGSVSHVRIVQGSDTAHVTARLSE